MVNIDNTDGVLAETWSPQGSPSKIGSVGGDLRLDIKEKWVLDDDIEKYKDICTTSIKFTTTHEFGHSLGLGHTNNKTSIMFPYATCSIKYGNLIKNGLENSNEDNFNIFNLYGGTNYIFSVNFKNKIFTIKITEELLLILGHN